MARRAYVEEETTKLFVALETTSATAFIDLVEDHIRGNTAISREFVLSARDKRPGHWGNTLLHRAVTGGFIWQARYLVEIGASIDAIDVSTKKATPLMHAILASNEPMTVFLVSSGASMSCQDVNDENALHYMARYGTVTMMKACAAASLLSPELLKTLASTPNVKMKFPEDLASNTLMRETLVNLRESGLFAVPPSSKRKTQKKKRKGGKKGGNTPGMLSKSSVMSAWTAESNDIIA
jgi:hypothetical protein